MDSSEFTMYFSEHYEEAKRQKDLGHERDRSEDRREDD
jgi:hypothetical protein